VVGLSVGELRGAAVVGTGELRMKVRGVWRVGLVGLGWGVGG
jgi:hypothetical protein